MKALILAAGYATRLYPLTKEFPKPLLIVEQRPIIDYIVDSLQLLTEMDEIIVVTNSKFVSIFREWASAHPVDKPLIVVDDLTTSNEDRLGAIGDTYFAIQKRGIHSDLLVIGGDNLFDGSLEDFLNFAKKNKPNPSIGLFDIQDVSHASRYGVVVVAEDGRIIDFQEKPKEPRSSLVAMCLYFFPAEGIGLIKEYLDSKSGKRDATGLYIDWLRAKAPVYGFTFSGRWYDIGDHKFYKDARDGFVKK